jgi:ribosomal protein L11 methyltransferase
MTSTCWQIVFTPSSQPQEKFLDFLDDFFEVNAQNYADSGQDEYVGYISGQFDEPAMLEAAKKQQIVLPTYKVIKLESENWLKDYVIKFEPFEIADFCIYGIHELQAPQTDKIPLQIYAATAFGSNHQTTQSCITALSELHKAGFVPQKILDVGTGSGILSLCAAKLWDNAKITASDIDEEAVIVTEGNAVTNHLDTHITTLQSDGYQDERIRQNAPYDLILSNILANPLIAFAADLSEHLVSQGYAVLSGFVDNQVEDVLAAHQKVGLKLIKLYQADNWRAALLQKE